MSNVNSNNELIIDSKVLEQYISDNKSRSSMCIVDVLLLTIAVAGDHSTYNLLLNNFMAEINQSVRYLEEKMYIKRVGGKLFTRFRTDELYKGQIQRLRTNLKQAEISKWIDDWRAIFPEGANHQGYRHRGNRLDCLQKMTKFVNSHKQFSIEEIFQATKNYVERFKDKDYKFMRQANFFIEKRGVGSTLESECEGLRENSNIKDHKDPGYGEKML